LSGTAICGKSTRVSIESEPTTEKYMMCTTSRAIGSGTMLLALFLVGCASQTIKNDELYQDRPGFRLSEEAEIRDNTKNRQVLDVVAQYQNAVTNKDFAALKRIVSEDYYSNSGTTDTTEDDYGNEQLGDTFEMMANYADEIRYKVKVQSISYKNDRAMVEYEYEYAYKFQVGDKPSWDAGVDMNELELVPEDDGDWKIASGL
jgi:hypothetical protein